MMMMMMKQWERSEDAMLLTLKMEEGVMSQGVQAAART